VRPSGSIAYHGPVSSPTPRKSAAGTTTTAAYDLVAEVAAIRRELEAAGEHAAGRALEDALTGSVVPGEFLSETRAQLRRLRRNPAAANPVLRARIDAAVAQLDAALGGRWRA
jgi:hypothetical protein